MIAGPSLFKAKYTPFTTTTDAVQLKKKKILCSFFVLNNNSKLPSSQLEAICLENETAPHVAHDLVLRKKLLHCPPQHFTT